MTRTMRVAAAPAVLLLGALLALPVKPMAQAKADVALRAAIETETVKGDLRGAIEQYKKIAQTNDRAVAAQALVRMAECYQKLGDAEARTIYERIVREFPDRKEEVALARTRLGGTVAVASARGDRPVWTGPNVDLFGRVSPDGRFITYVDWNNGRLMVHDVEANVDRALTPPAPNYSQSAGYSAISRDGKQVVYVWLDENDRPGFRIAALQGSGFLEPRQLFLASRDDVRFLDSFDWSPDRKWIAAAIRRRDGTGQIALIAVADGSFRVLKSMDWIVPERIFFSLDSKYIAYDLPVADSQQRDVYVLAIDGSRETPAVVHPAQEAVLGWSPDGLQLLFASDRTGSMGLWALPFANGKAQGSPELLKSDIGLSFSLGLTDSGALYTYRAISSRDIKIAPIDVNSGKLLGPPMSFVQGFLQGATDPNWSPDGKYLAYAACGGDCLVVRSVDNGQARRLASTLLYSRNPRWSPDGRSLLVAGRDTKGRDGLYQVDAQTGDTSPVTYTARLGGAHQWSPDGRKIYYAIDPGAIVERVLASGAEREVIRDPRVNRQVNLSPDGRYLAVQMAFDPSIGTGPSLLLVPVDGGAPRELMRLTEQERWGGPGTWTPDSKAVLKAKRTGSRTELVLVPITGAPPRTLDIDANIWTEAARGGLDQGFSLSPDGRSIAFLMGKSASEVWALENFLPAPSTKK